VEASAQATREAQTRSTAENVKRQLDAFVQSAPPPAASADVDGCVRKAAELLAGAGGDRYLIVAGSDALVPSIDVKLDRVQIRLVYLQCDDPASCDRAKQAWSGLAASANAANIHFSDATEGIGSID
jgi:hypothetical protein